MIGTYSTVGSGPHQITLGELRRKIERHDDFVFVMAMDRRRFETSHIEGSISFDELLDDLPVLPRDAEIVVYCTGPDCVASRLRAAYLTENGFSNVHRYPGGLAEWAACGLPIVVGHPQPA